MSGATPAIDAPAGHWSRAVAAALQSPAHDASWFALFDRSGQLLDRARDRAGEAQARLLREGDARRVLDEVVATGRACERRYQCEDRRLGPRSFDFFFHPLHHEQDVFGVLVQSRECTGRVTKGGMHRVHAGLLEHLDDAVLVTDPATVVRLANPAAQRLFLREGSSLVGTRLSQLHADAADAAQRARTHVVPWQLTLSDAQGTLRSYTGRSQPVTLGSETCVVTVLRDVTEETRLRLKRDQMMRDLHDGLGQDLTGISLMLRTLQRSLDAGQQGQLEIVESVLGIVRQMIDDTRAIAQGGAPARIPLSQLPVALDQLARSGAARSGLEVEFIGTISAALPPSEAIGTNLYRIAQEALTNALRHAGADRITVTLEAGAGSILLRVADDGNGFDAGAITAGAGLGNMRNRAVAIGAELCIDAAPGRGTRITCRLDSLREAAR